MERTISMMIGKGSINHNNRKFIADNVDKVRVKVNVTFINENVRKVYHELFDEAVANYNEKQKRNDRKIADYYENIRQHKKKKNFHEVIVQIGNKDDMACGTAEGDLAKYILQDYMETFQARNPYLRVFNAVIHMDEATPHLHINFVPFSTGNKRGPETQVSLKGALKAQGIVGSGRSDTEWNHWIEKEKESCAISMERYGVGWNHLDTHKEHLSVLEYKKQERTKEVQQLDEEKDSLEWEKWKLQLEVDRIYIEKRNYLEQYEKWIAELMAQDKELREDIADKESTKDILEQAIQNVAENLSEKEVLVEKAERRVSSINEMLNKYRNPSDQREKMIALQMRVYDLEEENVALRKKLQQAYDFMKSKFLNGVNMFEEFLKSIGAKVQEQWKDRNKGVR